VAHVTARIPGVVLAAGRSSRMGRQKALLPIGTGETFCLRVATTLLEAGIAPVVIVGRPGDAALRAAVNGLAAVRLVANPEPDRGQLSSLQAGLGALDPSAGAALVTLVDVPLVAGATVERLVHAWVRSGAPLIRPERGGRHGHPIVVARAVIDALLEASSARTTREVLEPFLAEALDVRVDDAFAFEDVDTPEEYARLLRLTQDPHT
jgi:molybdenum cofactor cytidylyltransferase